MSDFYRALGLVERRARAVTEAENKLELSIVAAHDAGASLRAIAERAGLTHETVRTIIRRRADQ